MKKPVRCVSSAWCWARLGFLGQSFRLCLFVCAFSFVPFRFYLFVFTFSFVPFRLCLFVCDFSFVTFRLYLFVTRTGASETEVRLSDRAARCLMVTWGWPIPIACAARATSGDPAIREPASGGILDGR